MNNWIEIDATDRRLGRLATQIANLIIGKGDPAYKPNVERDINVIVINCSKVKANLTSKFDYHHTGYIGNLKTKPKCEIDLDKIVKNAILGMLPKNKLFANFDTKLHCYLKDEHPYKGQTNDK